MSSSLQSVTNLLSTLRSNDAAVSNAGKEMECTRGLLDKRWFFSPKIDLLQRVPGSGCSTSFKPTAFRISCSKGFSSDASSKSSKRTASDTSSSHKGHKSKNVENANPKNVDVKMNETDRIEFFEHRGKRLSDNSSISDAVTSIFTSEDLKEIVLDQEHSEINESEKSNASEKSTPEIVSSAPVDEKAKLDLEMAKLEAERAKLEVEKLLKEKERQAKEIALMQARERELKALLDEKESLINNFEKEKKEVVLSKILLEQEFKGGKMFYLPQIVKANSQVEIYFHKSSSVLKNESSVSVMGACNDWLWGNFRADMTVSEVSNDWWTCKINVPYEAFKIDLVFYGPSNTFENNDQEDFHIPVTGGMNEEEFTRMFAEIKREEDKRKAEEAAERERIAEDERRKAQIRAEVEADRAQASRNTQALISAAEAEYKNASRSLFGVWYTKPEEMQPGSIVELFYNRSWRPLCFSSQVWIHAGFNHWCDGVSIVEPLSFHSNVDGDWWSVKVKVPENAYILNWVLGDGPVKSASVYDNNNGADYCSIVGPAGQSLTPYFKDAEERIFKRLQAERKEKVEAAAALAAKRARVKKELKEKTKETFLQSQAHILYTEPAEPNAGEPVTIFYNPSNTVLNGKPEVYFRGSFNRWTHKKGILPPIRMTPAKNGTHLQATVNVPLDAYVMDFVFSDIANDHGGVYDNRGNLDYHVPVKGGTLNEPPMNICHISLEMAPIAKVGGLGDVVTSLSRAVQELGHNVEAILPKYDCLKYNLIQNLEEKEGFYFNSIYVGVWHGVVEGVSVHFLEPQTGQFWVGCIYGRKDDDARFGFFCHIALEFLLQSGRRPDIIHCHDWSSAPAAWLFSEQYKNYGLANARTVFTIHNLEFGAALIGRAMSACHKATTVSPTYAREISTHGAISAHLGKFHGIINGIDPEIWDPLGDPFIPVPYYSNDVVEGKMAAKKELRQRLGLAQADKPMIGIVTRLTAQKGIHLIKHAIWRTLDRGGQVVLLGSAPDPRVQAEFEGLATQLSHSYSEHARLWLSYDEPLSHLIYAACDMILVPSIFEPCGLTQLIAMRYGAIPVVRKTGGLNDTVLDVDNDKERAKIVGLKPNGFSFEGTDAPGLDYALNRAISAWYDGREWWNGLAKTVMEQDWTWNRPALDYLELYYGARKN